MEKIVRKFASFEEAERADLEFYRSLTPQQSLDILLELVAQANGGVDVPIERVVQIKRLEDQ